MAYIVVTSSEIQIQLIQIPLTCAESLLLGSSLQIRHPPVKYVHLHTWNSLKMDLEVDEEALVRGCMIEVSSDCVDAC